MASRSPGNEQPMRDPLAGFRIVDLTVDRGELCGRLLSDLGADVIKVEPPGGSPARELAPLHEGVSLFFAARNAGKRSAVIDLDADPAKLHELLKERRRDAARASAERQRAGGTGVGLADGREQGHGQGAPSAQSMLGQV